MEGLNRSIRDREEKHKVHRGGFRQGRSDLRISPTRGDASVGGALGLVCAVARRQAARKCEGKLRVALHGHSKTSLSSARTETQSRR